jgi:hypothetical protein
MCLLFCAAGLSAQTFPEQFRTEDARIVQLLQSALTESGALAGAYVRLISVPANRVYVQMDEQARTAALRAAMPLVRQVVMSDAVQRWHDERIALRLGAVDHGLRLPPAPPNPRRRLEEIMKRMEKDPAASTNTKLMEEFLALQQAAANQGIDEALDSRLHLFTRPLAEAKREVERERETAAYVDDVRKCYDEALGLADRNPDRFRLLAFGCPMKMHGIEKSEAELDRMRRERAQRLYEQHCARAVIRQWLEEFLETAKTVDFTAQVERRGGTLVFANPAYERKDGLWKLIYRNGRQPTEAAVAFAREWLEELRPPAPASQAVRPAAGKAAPKK